MAAVNSHTLVGRFENDGTAKITTATDTITIKSVLPGTLRIMEGNRERLEFTDRSQQQTPLDGDDGLCRAFLSLRSNDFTAVTSCPALARAVDAASPNVKTYASIEFKVPSQRGSATGQKATFSNFWFDKVPEYRAGEKIDGLEELIFVCKLADFAAATY